MSRLIIVDVVPNMLGDYGTLPYPYALTKQIAIPVDSITYVSIGGDTMNGTNTSVIHGSMKDEAGNEVFPVNVYGDIKLIVDKINGEG